MLPIQEATSLYAEKLFQEVLNIPEIYFKDKELSKNKEVKQERFNILLVEDNSVNRKLVATLLKKIRGRWQLSIIALTAHAIAGDKIKQSFEGLNPLHFLSN